VPGGEVIGSSARDTRQPAARIVESTSTDIDHRQGIAGPNVARIQFLYTQIEVGRVVDAPRHVVGACGVEQCVRRGSAQLRRARELYRQRT
jgi:hypothetical protein